MSHQLAKLIRTRAEESHTGEMPHECSRNRSSHIGTGLSTLRAAEFPFAFLAAFGNKDTALRRLRTGNNNASDGLVRSVELILENELADVSGLVMADLVTPTLHRCASAIWRTDV